MTALETVPQTWDSARDERFFRITARLLPRAFVAAASALLASYDEQPVVRAGADRGVALCRVPAQAGRSDRG